jgi:hypothetical protein
MKNNSEKVYINFTQAADLLGYKSGVVIRKLINEDHLKAYSFPDTNKRMVEKNEVLALIQPNSPENEDTPTSES